MDLLIPNHSDQNVNEALLFGIKLTLQELKLPPSIEKDIDARATLLRRINSDLDFSHFTENIKKSEYFSKLVKTARSLIPDFSGTDTQIVGLILRLWAGCISAAKILSDKDATGNMLDAKFRSDASKVIDAYANQDGVYLAGVQSASTYRAIEKEQCIFDGISEESHIRFH
jgi:hypothetical protein